MRVENDARLMYKGVKNVPRLNFSGNLSVPESKSVILPVPGSTSQLTLSNILLALLPVIP